MSRRSEKPTESPGSPVAEVRPSGYGCVVAPLAAVAPAGVGVVLVGKAWSSCEIGVNSAANSFAVLPLFLLSWAAHALWWAAALVLGHRLVPGWKGKGVAVMVGTAGSLLLVWLAMAGLYAPDGYPATVCAPDNVPPWWPTWLPLP